MTALADKRFQRPFKFSAIELPGKTEQVYQGGRAFFDTSTGLVVKGFASTTLIPIGVFTESQNTASGGTVSVTLDREITARWYANSTSTDAIAAAQYGSDVFVVDDQTVAKTSASSTRSVAGRVWGVHATKGVLVESRP
jgi:hypothetical protein